MIVATHTATPRTRSARAVSTAMLIGPPQS